VPKQFSKKTLVLFFNDVQKSGASFTKLTCIPDVSFQNFIL
jgi:hypothetical protein